MHINTNSTYNNLTLFLPNIYQAKLHSVPFKVFSKRFDCHILLRQNDALSKIVERKVLDKLFTSLIKC